MYSRKMQIQRPNPGGRPARQYSIFTTEGPVSQLNCADADSLIRGVVEQFVDLRANYAANQKKAEKEEKEQYKKFVEQENDKVGFFDKVGNMLAGRTKKEEAQMYHRYRQQKAKNPLRSRLEALKREGSAMAHSIISLKKNYLDQLERVIEGGFFKNLHRLEEYEWIKTNSTQGLAPELKRRILQNLEHALDYELGKLSAGLKAQSNELGSRYRNIFTLLQTQHQNTVVVDSLLGLVEQLLNLNNYNYFQYLLKKKKHILDSVTGIWKKRTAEYLSVIQKKSNDLYRAELASVSKIRQSMHLNHMNEGFSNYPKYLYKGILLQANNKADNSNAKKEEISPFNLPIDQKVFKSLHPEKWLTSNVMSNFIEYAKAAYGFNSYDPVKNPLGVFIMKDSETAMMSQSYESFAMSYTEYKAGIFSKFKRIGLIVNSDNTHWYFAGINTQRHNITIYDSIATSSTAKYSREIGQIRDGLSLETKKSKGGYYLDAGNFCKQQSNSSDCGVWTLYNMFHFFTRPNIGGQIPGEEQQVASIRIGLTFMLEEMLSAKRKNRLIHNDKIQYAVEGSFSTENYRRIFPCPPTLDR